MKNVNSEIEDELMIFISQLPRIEGGMTQELKRAFRKLQSDILAEVARYDVAGVSAKSYQEIRAKKLLNTVNKIIDDAYKNAKNEQEIQLISLSKTAQESYIKSVNEVTKAELIVNKISSPQLKQLVKNGVIEGATSKKWWDEQSKDLQFKFENIVQDGIIQNDTTDAITRRIRGTKALNYNDGIMNKSFRNARALVQTSVQSTANSARIAVMRENSDVIEGIQWVSTLDGQTTAICKSLDGLMWDLNYKPIGHSQRYPGSTAHWNCRSTQISVIKKYIDLPAKKRKLFEGTRASMDGQVSESINYDEWLRNKNKTNPDFVRETLGAGKYKIWKDKKLSMTDMVDQFNNPLTVKQLSDKFN